MATKGYIPEKSGSKIPVELQEKWGKIQQRNYVGQGKWFLNGFWDDTEKDAEQIWKWAQKFAELDEKSRKEGSDLDEFASHKFLESLGETMTVIQMRQALREIDLDNNNRMSLLEYLTFKYKKSAKQVVDAPQGGADKEKINEAERLIQQAQSALEEVQRRLEAQKEAVKKQVAAEELAKKSLQVQKLAEQEQQAKLQEQKRAEDEVRKAEEEQRNALEELQRQEKEYKDKCEQLERQTQEGSLVQKNKAVQELASLKNEDPLPLRRAKINQEATVRKAEKLTKAVQEITRQVEELTKQMEEKTRQAQRQAEDAEQKRLESEEAARQLELATVDAENKVREAEENLQRVKDECRTSFGDIWWMERDIKEAKKFLPQRKQ